MTLRRRVPPVLVLLGLLLAVGPVAARPAPDLADGPVRLEGEVAAGGTWTRTVTGPDGLALFHLRVDDADLDLRIGAGDEVFTGTGSVGDEIVVCRLDGEDPARLTVTAPGEAGEFELRGVRVADGDAIRAGAAAGGTIDGRPVLHRVEAPEGTVVRFGLGEEARGVELRLLDGDLRAVAIVHRGTSDAIRATDGIVRVLARPTGEAGGAYRIETRAPSKLDPLAPFLESLATTDGQRAALRALRGHPDVVRIREYLETLPADRRLRFRAVPGLGRDRGVERYGSWDGETLVVNPAHPEHRRNPQELMDTILHELVHALMTRPRGRGFPLPEGATDAPHDPRLEGLHTMRKRSVPPRLRPYLRDHYGDGASNPEHEYIDINDVAQRWIIKIIGETLARSGAGEETLLFENEARRRGGPGEESTR